MRRDDSAEARWARSEFGDLDLGDSRRGELVVRLASGVAKAPGGRVSQVFKEAKTQQAAFDFLERKVETSEFDSVAMAMVGAVGSCTVKRLRGRARVLIVLDGSSVHVVNRGGKKPLGRLGPNKNAGYGVKMINALAVDMTGATVGLVDQQYWLRPHEPERTVARGYIKKKSNRCRPVGEKETRYWIGAIKSCEKRFLEHAPNVQRIYVIDREGDNRDLLLALDATGQGFIVRSQWDRLLSEKLAFGHRRYLEHDVSWAPVLGMRLVDVRRGGERIVRKARVEVRACGVTLSMRAKHGRMAATPLRLQVVQALELGTPGTQDPLHWRMLTNLSVRTLVDANGLLDAYGLRWRVEEFHKSLKTGACNAESTQLRSGPAAIRWITLLSSVAARIEQLKNLSRESPQLPATVAFTEHEVKALLFFKQKYKKRSETIPNEIPTLGQAVRWLADLGGFTGKSSGGPPGVTTIERGFERIRGAAEVFAALAEKSDQ